MKRTALLYILSLFVLLAFTCWVYTHYYDRGFKTLLKEHPGLNAAYAHYMDAEDKEKKKSVEFLIRNMPLHSWQTQYLSHKKTNDTLHFSAYAYPNLYVAISALDSLKKSYRLNTKLYPDIANTETASLVKDLELAHKIWHKSACKNYTSYKGFCNYVLPYRAGSEKPGEWRAAFYKKYQPYIKGLANDSIVKKVEIINERLKTEVEFDLRSHGEIYTPSVQETLSLKKGSCRALTELTACVMRSLGIPIAIDGCPVWGHRNSGHQWNAVKVNHHTWVPFGGAETNPDEFDTISDSVKAPKVYRYTYGAQMEDIHKKQELYKLPPLFRVPNQIDVTQEYVGTGNIELEIKNIPKGERFLYLSVFNAEEWKIVAWAALKNGKAVFKNMGNNNIVYLPVYYINNRVYPASEPFIFLKNNKRITISPVLTNTNAVKLNCYNKFYDIEWHEGVPQEGWDMELYYWDNEWVSCGVYNVKKDRALRYENVPKGALYLIKSFNFENTWQRIFTIENNKQFWY